MSSLSITYGTDGRRIAVCAEQKRIVARRIVASGSIRAAGAARAIRSINSLNRVYGFKGLFTF